MKMIKLGFVAVMALMLSGCGGLFWGERVTVGPAEVGKIATPDGYQEGIINTSTFRLDPCGWPGQVCDRLIRMDVSDRSKSEHLADVYMPKDKLRLQVTVGLTLGFNEEGIDRVFNRVPPEQGTELISVNRVYEIYAQRIIRENTMAFVTRYTIDELVSNRERIGAELAEYLTESLAANTPFIVRHAGFEELELPNVIVTAQEDAAKRRADIAREEAQLEVSRASFQRQREEASLQRAVEVEKAEAEAEVNRILAESVTPTYETYRMLNALDALAESDNTKFIPMGMLDSMASQVMIGNQ